MNSTHHFLHIYPLDFPFANIFLPSGSKKILWSNKFLKYPLVEIIFHENQDDLCFLEDLGLWILTAWPFHSYALAYCKPIHLIFIEFGNIDNNLGTPPKKCSSPSLAICAITLIEIFLQSIRIVRHKILQLKKVKIHFIFIFILYANKYILEA
jgi:hypothetical protein